MSRVLRFDRPMLVTVLGLTALGLVMIYSSSAVLAFQRKGVPGYFFVRQCSWAAVGLIAMLAAMKIPLSFWQRKKVVYGLAGLEILLLVVALAGPTINGSHRWIRFGPFTLQPSETAKLVMAIFLAYQLDKRVRVKRGWPSTLLVICAYAGIVAGAIVIQPDLGSVVILGTIVLAVLFLDGLPLRWLGVLLLAGVMLVGTLIVTSPYRFQRLLTFLNPDNDPQRSGFQARQSLIAVGSGGLAGKWLGGGSQKRLFLPEPHTDFIYAMVGEELGLAGAALVLAGFLALGLLGTRAALNAPDHFTAMLVFGIVMWILIQALIHIGVTVTLLPTKGLPLPFLSYGGSSLVVTMTAAGILLNASHR